MHQVYTMPFIWELERARRYAVLAPSTINIITDHSHALGPYIHPPVAAVERNQVLYTARKTTLESLCTAQSGYIPYQLYTVKTSYIGHMVKISYVHPIHLASVI